jgi:nucleotide-binding universal stress UspA family protein
LIGLDSTASRTSLVELAVRWARQSSATLVGLAIVDEPGIRAIEPAFPVGGTPGVDPVYYVGYESRLTEAEASAASILQDFSAVCSASEVAHAQIKAVGSPVAMIEEEAQCCDLILIAQRPRFRFSQRDKTSDDTLFALLKNAPRPIVAVPEVSASLGSVLVAYDGSLQASRALAAFEATELGERVPVHILSVDRSAFDAARHAEQARRFLAHHGIEAHPLTIESSLDPAAVIQEQIRRLGASLLVMGACGQPVLREFFVGSVTRRMLKESDIPLFLFH